MTLFAERDSMKARAVLVGERLDLRSLETVDRLATAPLVVVAGDKGCAVLFRYGAVVLFGVSPVEEVSFLAHLKSLIKDPFKEPEIEEAELRRDANQSELIDNGVFRVLDFSVERLQIIADILAKSVVLAQDEASIADVFDSIEPLAFGLHLRGKNRWQGRELLKHIGGTLLIQHKMVGLVEVSEKPETLWDRPDLERLYLRLEDEYELKERHTALERKLSLVSHTAQTVLELLQHNSGMRVEWYIFVLIVFEICLTLYEMFFKH